MKGSMVAFIVMALLFLAALIALYFQYRKNEKYGKQVIEWNKNKVDAEKRKQAEAVKEIEVIDAEIETLEDLQKTINDDTKKEIDSWRGNNDAERATEFFTKRYGEDSRNDGQ